MKEKTVRSLCFIAGGLLWVMLAMMMYAKATRTLATGVALSIVDGDCTHSGYAAVSCIVSNGTSNAISFFKVYDDGFGCSVEWQEDNSWKSPGAMWCATGREVVKLCPNEAYSFTVKVSYHSMQRLSVEYWDGEPLISAPKHVKSDPFVCVPDNRSTSDASSYAKHAIEVDGIDALAVNPKLIRDVWAQNIILIEFH